METIYKTVRNKITLTFTLYGLPSVFLLLSGSLLSSFGNVAGNVPQTIAGYALLTAGFALFVLEGIKAGKIYVWEAQQKEALMSSMDEETAKK